jgi:ketosteroid isomerase-like protein
MRPIHLLAAALLAASPALASAQSVEERLRRVEDELAISRVLVDYAATLDSRNYAAYVQLFTPDAEWANSGVTRKGRADIEKMLAMMGPAGAVNNANYHLVSNPRIDVKGDTATAVSLYLFITRGKDGTPLPSLSGTYTDEFVRWNGAWKIKRRYAGNIMPTPEEWGKIMTERLKP